MAWLRIDDGFAQHPKVVSLTPRDRWTWLEILCYCARYRTEGKVPASVKEVVRGATTQYLHRAQQLGLLDSESPGEYTVHDWPDYNGRDPKIVSTERKRRLRSRDNAGTDDGTLPGQTAGQQRDIRRDESGTRAQPRGRVPVPNPNQQTQPTNQATEANYAADRPQNGHLSPGMAGWLGQDEQDDLEPEPPPGYEAIDFATILKDIPQ